MLFYIKITHNLVQVIQSNASEERNSLSWQPVVQKENMTKQETQGKMRCVKQEHDG